MVFELLSLANGLVVSLVYGSFEHGGVQRLRGYASPQRGHNFFGS